MSPPNADLASLTIDAGCGDFLSSTFEHLTQGIVGPRSHAHDLTMSQAAALLRQAERIINEQRAHIDRLQRLSLTDELTGLLNRRGFERELRRATAALRRHGHGSAVLLADLDGFKLINDTYGHQAGDFVLAEVARRLVGALRDTDVVARLGGDEFAAILTHCDPALLTARLERLRLAVEDHPIPWRSRSLMIGVSIGLAQMHPDNLDGCDAMHMADTMMYGQKQRRKATAAE